MLTVVLFYFFLCAFWLENVIQLKIATIIGLSLQNIIFFLLFLVWAITCIKKRKIFESNRVNKYLFLLFVVICVSIPLKYLLNEVPDLNLFEEMVSLKELLNPILLFFIFYNLINDMKSCKHVMAGLIVFLIITMISTFAISTGLFQFGYLNVVSKRSSGFGEPNQYASYLVLFLPLLFSGALFADTKKKRTLSVAVNIVALICLLMTGSRGGVISLFFCVCVYLFVFSRQGLIRPIVFILVLLVGIPVLGASAYFFAPSHVKEIVVNRFDISKVRDRDELTSGRNILWANGFQLFLESPLFGHGLATFIPLMKKNFHVYGNSHNDYLLYLVHYGVIGLGLFLMVLWSIFRESMHIVRHTSDAELRILSLSYFAGLSGYAVAMFGVNVIQPQFLFWVYTAVLLKYGRLVKPLEIESYGCQP